MRVLTNTKWSDKFPLVNMCREQKQTITSAPSCSVCCTGMSIHPLRDLTFHNGFVWLSNDQGIQGNFTGPAALYNINSALIYFHIALL